MEQAEVQEVSESAKKDPSHVVQIQYSRLARYKEAVNHSFLSEAVVLNDHPYDWDYYLAPHKVDQIIDALSSMFPDKETQDQEEEEEEEQPQQEPGSTRFTPEQYYKLLLTENPLDDDFSDPFLKDSDIPNPPKEWFLEDAPPPLELPEDTPKRRRQLELMRAKLVLSNVHQQWWNIEEKGKVKKVLRTQDPRDNRWVKVAPEFDKYDSYEDYINMKLPEFGTPEDQEMLAIRKQMEELEKDAKKQVEAQEEAKKAQYAEMVKQAAKLPKE